MKHWYSRLREAAVTTVALLNFVTCSSFARTGFSAILARPLLRLIGFLLVLQRFPQLRELRIRADPGGRTLGFEALHHRLARDLLAR